MEVVETIVREIRSLAVKYFAIAVVEQGPI